MSTTTTDKPRPEIAIDGFPKRQSGFGRMITSADHKDIAKILMVGSGGFLFIAALEWLLMRMQLAIPGNTFLSPVTFNRILSLYGATAIFFFARVIRAAIVDSLCRKARATSAVLKPHNSRNVRAI